MSLDPCSNGRSHIQADHKCDLQLGGDGLYQGAHEEGPGWYHRGKTLGHVDTKHTVFVNPPYGRNDVIKWVEHYRHTRFIFLLRWDPSTRWFSGLLPYCTHVWFPSRRINFEPPPGVKSSSNPFPHALYLRAPKVRSRSELLERLRPHGYLLDVGQQTNHNISHEAKRIRRDDKVGGGGSFSSFAALKRGEQVAFAASREADLSFPQQWCEDIDTTPRPSGCQHDSCGLCGT